MGTILLIALVLLSTSYMKYQRDTGDSSFQGFFSALKDKYWTKHQPTPLPCRSQPTSTTDCQQQHGQGGPEQEEDSQEAEQIHAAGGIKNLYKQRGT